MYLPALLSFRGRQIVNRLAQKIEHSRKSFLAHRNGNSFAGINSVDTSHKSICRAHGNTSYYIVAYMLSHLNNELGRVKGNEVLRRFADFIKEASATCGTVYYNGGWQFIGFFEQCRREDAESFADYMHRLVHAYNEESGDAKMEYSLGMAESRTANAHTLRTLLRGAMMDRRKQED